LILTAGKFSGTDVLDGNSYAHDPRTQFNNWSIWDTATWDYAADTRGYTYGVAVELTRGQWTSRLAFLLEPRESNGIHLDRDVRHAHGDNFELEHDHTVACHAGKVLGMVFINHAQMGSYREAVERNPTAPEVIATRRKGRIKWGVGLNAEQELTPTVGMFVRAGWNDGRTESWAFTEIERTVVFGASITPTIFRRPSDRIGIAVVNNGISRAHRDYFAAGGYGFMLGDGRLRYGAEHLIDAYYSWQIARWAALTGEVQHFSNLAFNRDRGPVTVYGARVHLQY
jgi:carbohydrate-selective porin OprB